MTASLLAVLLAVPGFAAAKPAAPPKISSQTYALPVFAPSSAPVTVALVLERFTQFDKELKSLTCDFRQFVRWDDSGVTQAVEGSLEYRKPSLLHIEHRLPDSQTLVADGQWLWIWRRSTNQVIQTKLEEWKKSEPLAQGLLDFGNYAELLKKYEVSLSTAAAADGDKDPFPRFELVLRPKDASADFVLKLRLSAKDFFPADTELRAGAVVVHSQFTGIRYNPPLADQRFTFAPPAGADVFQNFKPPKAE